MRYPLSTSRQAFTLIEMLVVVTIIAILAGLTLPRLTGNSYRQAEIAVDEVADLLALYAHRESMGYENIALGYDPEAGSIMLLELIGDPTNSNNPPRWEFDLFVNPVELPPDLNVVSVKVDGISLRDDDWFIPVIPGQGRQTIELTLSSFEFAWTIHLPAYSLSPFILGVDETIEGMRVPVDLDAQGRDNEVWR